MTGNFERRAEVVFVLTTDDSMTQVLVYGTTWNNMEQVILGEFVKKGRKNKGRK